jgi:hypothetical protein
MAIGRMSLPHISGFLKKKWPFPIFVVASATDLA